MKKVILSIILILALLLSFAACDLGNDKDDDKKDDKDAAYDENTKDNIAALVNTINTGLDFETMLENVNTNVETEQIDYEAIIGQLKQTAAQMLMTLSAEGSDVNMYMGMKDSSICLTTATPDGATEAWAFLEDDYKVVTVTQGEYGYEAEVVADLSEYLGMMDVTTSVNDPQVEEILNLIKGIELPEITKKDISFKDGKYYISNDYLLDLFGAAFQTVYDYAMEMEGAFSTEYDYDYDYDYDVEEDYEEAPAMDPEDIENFASEIINGLNLKFYFHMENEAVTGFGVSAKPGKMNAVEIFGCNEVEFLIDINKADCEIKAYVANDDGVQLDCRISTKAEFDADGNFKKYTFEADLNVPYSDYKYLTYGEELMLSGMQRMYANITFDAENLVSGKGEWMKAQWSYETSDITASVWDEDEFEYVFSQELTDMHAKDVPEFNITLAYEADSFNAHADVTADGEKVVIDADYTTVKTDSGFEGSMAVVIDAAGEEVSFTASVVADAGSASDFPKIPVAVQSAREEAVAEYDYYY